MTSASRALTASPRPSPRPAPATRAHRGAQELAVQADEGVASTHRNAPAVQMFSHQLGVGHGKQHKRRAAVDDIHPERGQARHHLGAQRRSRRAPRSASATASGCTARRDRLQLQRAQRPVRAPRRQPVQHVRGAQRVADPQTRPATRSWSGCAAPPHRAAPRRPATPAHPGQRRRRPRRPPRCGRACAARGSARAGAAPRSGWSGCRPRPDRLRRARRRRPGRTAGQYDVLERHPGRGQRRLRLGERRRDQRGRPRAQVGQQREPFGRPGQQRDLVGAARVPRRDGRTVPASRRRRSGSGPGRPSRAASRSTSQAGGSSARTLTAKSSMPGPAAWSP